MNNLKQLKHNLIVFIKTKVFKQFLISILIGFTISSASIVTAKEIYLDYQASTPIDPVVLKAMWPYLTKEFGNPHASDHNYGKRAASAVNNARLQVANLIGARDPNSIIFTSGATEANNLAILGTARALKGKRNKIITCITEHKAVLETAKSLDQEGFEVVFLKVNQDGLISLDELEKNLDSNTALVSIMTANNEIGVIQPIGRIGKLVHKYGALLHTDATQAVGKIPLNVELDNIDLLSLSSHKIYGPKGVGVLYVHQGIKINPIMHGGGQEQAIRPGTVPVFLAVGLGKAAELAKDNLISESQHIVKLRDSFLQELQQNKIKYLVHGSMQARIAGNLNISFANIDGEEIIKKLPNLAVSLGSACSSSNSNLSYVVCALHTVVKPWGNPIRISFGRFTSEKDVKDAANELISVVKSVKTKTRVENKRASIQLREKYELAYVFLGSCPYCHIFAPTVKDFAKENNFPITGITVDGGKVADFPNAKFDVKFARQYNIESFPTLLARTNASEPFKVIVEGALTSKDDILKVFLAMEQSKEGIK